MELASPPPTGILKALSDPVRWSIVKQIAEVDELACVALEDAVPVSKPTISYHVKILREAGLIDVRKSGRNYYYSLRRDVLHTVIDQLWQLAPTPRPVMQEEDGQVAVMGLRKKRAGGALPSPSSSRKRRAVTKAGAEEAIVLTW